MVSDAIMMGMQQAPEDMGRGGDTVLAHMSLGEVVIPRAFMEDPEVRQFVEALFQSGGADIREFTVGDPANKINPETGYAEFGFFSKVFKVFKRAAPIIASFAAPYLAPALGITSLAGTAALGAGLGAAGGAVSGGGLKGALIGAATGGVGSYLGAGGSLGNNAVTRALGLNPTYGPATASQVASAGSTNAALSGLGKAASTGSGSLTKLTSPVSSILSGLQQSSAQDDIEEQLLEAQGKAEAAMQPYSDLGLQGQKQLASNLESGFDPSNLTSDAGYQYRLQQGNEQLSRALSAQGMTNSGAAIKQAQELGQGLASQQYDTAYNQWALKNNQLAGLGNTGRSAATSLSDIYTNQGNITANNTQEQSNIFSNTLSGLLGKRIIGYDPTTGKAIYG